MRTLKEKYASSRLHMSWAIFIAACWMTWEGVLTPEIWLGTITVIYGGYSLVSYGKDKLHTERDLGEGVN